MSDAVFIYLGRCVLFRLLPAVRKGWFTFAEGLANIFHSKSHPPPVPAIMQLPSVKNYTQLCRGRGPASGLARKSPL